MKKYSFILLAITLIIGCFSISHAGTFYDILDTKYEGIVESLAFLKIVDGVSQNIFDANKVVTRAELAKMLVVAHGYEEFADLLEAKNEFKDVKKGTWYYDYVNIATAYGLVKGYPDGNFYPDREVTYAEAVAMILRSLGHKYIEENSEYGWYYNYILRMRDLKLNDGMEVFYNEKGAKRGDVAILIWNMLRQNTWKVIKEEGTGNLTYADSGEILIEKVFGEDYELINGNKIKKFFASDGKMYAVIEGKGEYELKDSLPIYAVGAKVTGVVSKKDKILSCAVYDMDLGIVEGYKEELEEDGYKVKKANEKYYYGGKNDDYIFYAVRRNKEGETIERAIILDLTNKIIIEKIKKEKSILTINESLEIDTSDAVILDGKRFADWGKLKEDDAILHATGNIYILANEYKTEDELYQPNKKSTKKDDNIYYISSIQYNGDKVTLKLISSEKSTQMVCTASVKDYSIGDFVNVTIDGGQITKLEKANTKSYADLKNGKELVTDYSDKDYFTNMIGKYKIDDDTQICLVTKTYKNNTDSVIEKCTLERVQQDELNNVDDEIINIIAKEGVAKVIYIERETNKFSKFYAKVKEVIQEDSDIYLTVSPIDLPVIKYKVIGKGECEPGDLISYTLSGKEGEEELKIDEVYRGGVIGYKGDYIVKSVDNEYITLTNGEVFDKTSSVISLGDKRYKISKYIIILAKARKDEKSWVFSSTTFAEMKKIKLSPGDRIAIDELEGAIVIYTGYTD